MSVTVGERRRLAHYRTCDGLRVLCAQRIDGRVALVDEPMYDGGRVLLIERHVRSQAELEGLCRAYIEHSQHAGRPAILAQRDTVERLAAAFE